MEAMDADEAKRYVKAIKIIHRYELSVPMRDSERILRIVNGEYKLNREITPKILKDSAFQEHCSSIAICCYIVLLPYSAVVLLL